MSAGIEAGGDEPAFPAARPLRVDAERNRVRIMAAAREVFADRGLGATMEDIASRAGVGVGTMYRRWTNKEALIEELFQDGMASLLEVGRRALEHEDPWEGLVQFLEGMLQAQAADRGLKEIILGTPDTPGGVDRAPDQFAPIAAGLVSRAQASGQLRADVEGTDVGFLQLMVGEIVDVTRDVDADLWRRYLGIVLDGMRAGSATPLPAPPLPLARVGEAMANWQPHRS